MHPDYSTILIVDNAEFIRMVVRLRLEGAGVVPRNIHEAENGQEAYDLLVAKGISNILCDYEMEVMDGIELAIKLLIVEQRRNLRKPDSGKAGPRQTPSAPGFQNWPSICPFTKNNTAHLKNCRYAL